MDTAFSAIELEQFRRDGFFIVRGMVDSAACDRMEAVTREHLRQQIPPLEYEAELGYPGAPASLDAPGGRTVRRLRDAYGRDACFRDWAQDKRVVRRAEQILEEPACLVLAHHNCVMTKHPNFGTATGWHRDIRYWRFTRPDLVSVWLALGEERASNGGLLVIPGSHRLQLQPEQLDDLDFLRPEVPENQALFAKGIPVELQRGDVLFFHSLLFHAAGRNDSNAVKDSVVFAYRAASNLPLPGTRSAAAGDVPLSH
jgi:phytanoyl-CoA hydroxylase